MINPRIFICSLIICILCFAACNQQQADSTDSRRVASFNHFIHKFKILPLPLKLNDIHLNKDTFKHIDEEDTLFIKDPSCLYYGLLDDTSHFFAVIMLGVADSYVPNLFTFDKNGKAVGSTALNVYGCPYGPGIGYCSSSGTISKDFSIHCHDSTYIFEVDSNTNQIQSSKQLICNSQHGKIRSDGTILLKESNSTTHVP